MPTPPDPGKTSLLHIKKTLIDAILESVEGLTQIEAAKKLASNQPRISNLRTHKYGAFTVEALIKLAVHAGYSVQLLVTGGKKPL